MKTGSSKTSQQSLGDQLLLGSGEDIRSLPAFSRELSGRGSRQSRFRRPSLSRQGKKIGFEPLSRKGRPDLGGSIRTAWKAGRTRPVLGDLVGSVSCQPASRLSIFVLDVSDSMAPALELMRSWLEAKTMETYFRRDPLALITVQGHKARVLAQPTTSIGMVLNRLQSIRVGGGTPLGHGLTLVRKMIVQWRNQYPAMDLFVITDGKSTTPLTSTPVRRAAAVIANQVHSTQLINASTNCHLEHLAGLLKARLVTASTPSGGQP